MTLESVKRLIPQRSPVRLLWHEMKVFAAALRYGFPARKLVVIGVTGTDGKTTTVGMTAHILQTAGIPTAALSTAFFRIGDAVTWNATQKTSPSPFVIQRFLRDAAARGCTHAVVEYSSHGLVQGRTQWTWPRVAAITNTSAEHLDYHGTMERYRDDKAILFRMLGRRGTKVLHREDGTYETYRRIPSDRTIVYATTPPPAPPSSGEKHLWTKEILTRPAASAATLRSWESGQAQPTNMGELVLNIPGSFNVENALCAVGCALAAGVPPAQSLAALRTFTGVPGRMESIPGPQGFSVFVDFTVTPASYEKTLTALRATLRPGGRLLVLTGSCGDRMREKRPVVGRICSRLADVVVVTNEDPYTEDPEKIIDEVWAGVDRTATDARRIADRREAMRFLFSSARPGDIVLLCGKGSDTTMWVKDGQVPWNERGIAGTLLEQL